jgi:HPt (histidine-containing phosphotransfer) domain-containing protein
MVLNKSKIAELRELEVEAGEEILTSLTALFKRDLPESLIKLRALIMTKQYPEAGKLVHKMKTSYANIGVTDGHAICLELETQCKNSNNEFDYASHLQRLTKVTVTAIKELETEIRTQRATA